MHLNMTGTNDDSSAEVLTWKCTLRFDNSIGKFEVVRKILFNLYHYMSYVNENSDTSTGPLPIPLEVILKTDVVRVNNSWP